MAQSSREAEAEVWADRQVAKAPKLGEDPRRAARIARALGIKPAKDKTGSTLDQAQAQR